MIKKAKSMTEVYQLKSKSKNIHELSGRSSHKITKFVNRCIETSMLLTEDDTVLDIGCGDGSFLYDIHTKVKHTLGVVPSQEEYNRLINEYKGHQISFSVGLATELPSEDGCFSKIVCNGVFILLGTIDEAVLSMREIYRVAKPGAYIWIGEVPIIDENRFYNRTYNDSIVGWLIYLFVHHGFKAFRKGMYKVCRSLFCNEMFIVGPKKLLTITEAEMLELASQIGFHVIDCERHKMMNKHGQVELSPTRMNYIFQK